MDTSLQVLKSERRKRNKTEAKIRGSVYEPGGLNDFKRRRFLHARVTTKVNQDLQLPVSFNMVIRVFKDIETVVIVLLANFFDDFSKARITEKLTQNYKSLSRNFDESKCHKHKKKKKMWERLRVQVKRLGAL
jgi:hypothetical protein